MSLETWKAEFYPVDAKDVSESDALAHSLKKWEGLRKENLERHKCWMDGGVLVDSEQGFWHDEKYALIIASSSCALCNYYQENTCNGCPLKDVRGAACDDVLNGGSDAESEPPYGIFLSRNHNPEPMIQLIQLAIERQEKKS